MDPDTVQTASQVRRKYRTRNRYGTVVPVNNPNNDSVRFVGTGTAVYNVYYTGRYRTVCTGTLHTCICTGMYSACSSSVRYCIIYSTEPYSVNTPIVIGSLYNVGFTMYHRMY